MGFARNNVFPLNSLFHKRSFDNAVGRAGDCRSVVLDILRSLVRIRLEGIFYFFNIIDSSRATFCKRFYTFFVCITNLICFSDIP